jgi:chitinase
LKFQFKNLILNLIRDKKTGHNSPLYSSKYENEEERRLNVDWSIRLYYTLGVPLGKLIMGIPFYGRSFTLENERRNSFGASIKGDGEIGKETRERGFLSFGLEICKYLKYDNWTRVWSEEQKVPFAYKDNQWVGYDDEGST